MQTKSFSFSADGSCPFVFSLAPEDITSFEIPQHYYLLIDRNTYFFNTGIVEKLFKYFSNFIATNTSMSTIWFEHALSKHYSLSNIINSQINSKLVLRSDLPVGLFYDLLSSRINKILHIIVHFSNNSNYNYSEVNQKNLYFNTLKQSLFILFQSVKIIIEFNNNILTELYNNINNNPEVVKQYILNNITKQNSVISLPIRFVLLHTDNNNNLQISYLQYSFNVQDNNNNNKDLQSTKLSDVINFLLPNLSSFNNNKKSVLQNENVDSTTSKLVSSYIYYNGNNQNSKYILLINGIEVPDYTPINYCYNLMSSNDMFLYIIIKEK